MPVTDEFDGHKFFTVVNMKRAATPLFAALVVVEVTDVIFALDSVPAVLAVSNEPFIVFAANAFAILGLRAMYFLLANARQRFHYLSHALGGILVFVGIKMAVSHWYHMNTYVSLAIILAMLLAAVIFSERKARQLGLADRAVRRAPPLTVGLTRRRGRRAAARRPRSGSTVGGPRSAWSRPAFPSPTGST